MEFSQVLSEILEPDVKVTVDGIVVTMRAGNTPSKPSGRVAFNFVVKDILGDTANAVYWHEPGALKDVSTTLQPGE